MFEHLGRKGSSYENFDKRLGILNQLRLEILRNVPTGPDFTHADRSHITHEDRDKLKGLIDKIMSKPATTEETAGAIEDAIHFIDERKLLPDEEIKDYREGLNRTLH